MAVEAVTPRAVRASIEPETFHNALAGIVQGYREALEVDQAVIAAVVRQRDELGNSLRQCSIELAQERAAHEKTRDELEAAKAMLTEQADRLEAWRQLVGRDEP